MCSQVKSTARTVRDQEQIQRHGVFATCSRGKKENYRGLFPAFYNTTLPFQLRRSEQFARLDSAKSFSSSVDFVSVNLSFPHSPFLSAVFCDQCYSLSSEPITALILLLKHIPVTFPHRQRTTNDCMSTNVKYNVTHDMQNENYGLSLFASSGVD